MKHKVTPTQVEKAIRDEDFLVSKTDPKGRITYGNRAFIELSGYSEAELLGSQHNIIRHPDMPRAVFKLLWERIQSGRECNAYVKNMAKDGAFYWVFANVTPDLDVAGRITGYFSVRRKPRASALAAVTGLYRTMLEAEHAAGTREAIAASTRVLEDFLSAQGMTYDELVLAI
jgi:PAS domain S-box-containing protein